MQEEARKRLFMTMNLRCLVDYVGNFFKQQLEQLSSIPHAKPALALYQE